MQDALIDIDRDYNVGPNDFSKIGISLLNDVARNDLAGAAYELAGNTVTEKFNFALGPERRAMMEAMVLLGFDVGLNRNNDIGKLSGNVSASLISSFLMTMNGSETGRHWPSSQDVGGSLLHALGEWSFSQDAGQFLFQAGGEFNRTHQGNGSSAGQAPTAGSTDSISQMGGNFSSSGPRLDGATLDRAGRLTARLGAAPVRHSEGDAAERVPQAGGPKAAASGTGAGYLAHPQDISPGAAVGPAGGAMHPAAGHDAGGTKNEGLRQRSRSAAARSQAAARAAMQAAAVQIARQARVDMRAGEELDLASFAALGGPSHLDVAAAAGMGQVALTMRAAPLRLPDRVAGMATGAGPGTAVAAYGSYVPDWDAALWTQSGPGLAQPLGSGAAGESSAWLTPTQGSPAAPRAVSVAAGAERTGPSFPEQGRGAQFPSLLGLRAADAWAGPAGTSGQVAASEDGTAFAGFGASDGASRRALDEMARLASRPPVGITGFDAAQMPAWLGGWTGIA